MRKTPDSNQNRAFFMELLAGFEPATCWLRISCSTDWATVAHNVELYYHISVAASIPFFHLVPSCIVFQSWTLCREHHWIPSEKIPVLRRFSRFSNLDISRLCFHNFFFLTVLNRLSTTHCGFSPVDFPVFHGELSTFSTSFHTTAIGHCTATITSFT